MISTAAALTGLGGALAIRQRTLTRKPRVMGVVTEISSHPIKSCGGLSLQACDIYAAGLEHDRRWVIAKLVLAEEDGGANGSSPSPSKTLCKVCFEREITTMRIPCEHSMCAECAAPRLCPYCKAPMQQLPSVDTNDLIAALRRCMGSPSARSFPGTPRGRSDSVGSDR